MAGALMQNVKRYLAKVFPSLARGYLRMRRIREYDNLIEKLSNQNQPSGLVAMLGEHLANEKIEKGTSNIWLKISLEHIHHLISGGIQNFKQTLALRYFSSIFPLDSEPMHFLIKNYFKNSGKPSGVRVIRLADLLQEHYETTREHARAFNLMEQPQEKSLCLNLQTYLAWDFVSHRFSEEILAKVEEPAYGNPAPIFWNEKRISYDLASSLIEYDAIFGLPALSKVSRVVEIGAGYGRTAYVTLTLKALKQYCIVDIPPALYVAQEYLSRCFPDLKVFRFRPFVQYEEVRDEFERAQIAFLMPNQLRLMPDNAFDLSIAIDCLHEMRPHQIQRYFDEFDRISELFFMKYKKATVLDGIMLTQATYPFLNHWKLLSEKASDILPHYIESLYATR